MGEMSKLLKFNIMLGERTQFANFSNYKSHFVYFYNRKKKRKPGNRYKSSNYAAH